MKLFYSKSVMRLVLGGPGGAVTFVTRLYLTLLITVSIINLNLSGKSAL